MLPPPIPPLPLDNPLRDPVEYILGVGRDLHLTRFLERKQALDRRHEFHPVVGGVRIESEELPLYATEPKKAGPPSWPGITETRAVGDQRDFLHTQTSMAARQQFSSPGAVPCRGGHFIHRVTFAGPTNGPDCNIWTPSCF